MYFIYNIYIYISATVPSRHDSGVPEAGVFLCSPVQWSTGPGPDGLFGY